MRHTILLAGLLALCACGTRGNLTLLPGPAPAPIFGNSSPPQQKPEAIPDTETPATTGDVDLNTVLEGSK